MRETEGEKEIERVGTLYYLWCRWAAIKNVAISNKWLTMGEHRK